MEDATWLALTLTLTLLAGGWTWLVARKRGPLAIVRGVAITLVPPAAYLTGTLEAGVEIGGVIGDWATALVFSPKVWAGLILAGISVLLFVLTGFLGRRGIGGGTPTKESKRAKPAESPALPAGKPGAPVIDDDLADIEAILKKRGIS
jgi:hypothetical protein